MDDSVAGEKTVLGHPSAQDGEAASTANHSAQSIAGEEKEGAKGSTAPSTGSDGRPVVGTTKAKNTIRDYDEEKHIIAGEKKFHKLGWKKLTICMIVEAIALGTLSMPKVFASLGMVAGVLITVGLGFIAIYTSWIIGKVKLAYPDVQHYTDAGRLMFGSFGYYLFAFMFVAQLVLSTGSHALTGTIAFNTLSNDAICSVAFGVISAIILFLVALPPTFSEMAILGYIDFASIVVAVMVTIIATGIQARDAPGGLSGVNWSAWPKPGLTFAEAFVQVSNVVFAYSFAFCQFSFMDEMDRPRDYIKSIWALGITEIVIYTLSGSLIYAFVGIDVQSPALLSGGEIISKVVFGLALPVIFVSGSINTTVASKFIHGQVWKKSVIRYVNTPKGWIYWTSLVAGLTVIAWVIAEAIPFFSDLLSVMSSLFISGFTFYFPALMWFMLLKKGSWYGSTKNIILSVMNGLTFVIGVAILGCGTYASVQDIIDQYKSSSVRSPFTCGSV
ncbi:unnamed protein product [Parajaminaea phylloscopi]